MKKLIITGISACVLAAGLTGCNTLNRAGQTGNAVVGTGVGVVGAVGTTAVRGVGAVGSTAVRGVGAVGSTTVHAVGSGVNYVTGKPATYHNTKMYRNQGVVHRNGHAYRIQNGRYVLVR